MSDIIDTMKKMESEKILNIPKGLIENTNFLTIMGSVAYNASSDISDMDVYGFMTPALDVIFPVLAGEIPGFGQQIQRFKIYTENHKEYDDKEYDFNIYNIVNFVQLCMENNPNVLDALFVGDDSILYRDSIADHILENRRLFLHKGAYHKYKGFAHSQVNKMENGTNSKNPKRLANIEKYGFDTKFGYHVVRLLLQAEQVLVEHDMDITQNGQLLRDIRNGAWTKQELLDWKQHKEKELDELYETSTLRHTPDVDAVKEVLVNALEIKYGSLPFDLHKKVKQNNIRIPSL